MNNIFSQNKKKSIKRGETYSFVYNKVYLIKGTSKTLLSFMKNTLKYINCQNFQKTAFDVLVFDHAFQIGCVCISNYGLNRRTH